MITRMKYVNNFQIAKVQTQSTAYDLLDFFYQFQPSISCKSVAYKKKFVFDKLANDIQVRRVCTYGSLVIDA